MKAEQPEPRFAAGDAVTVKKTGRNGKVVENVFRDGRMLYLVDQPHGGGILRQYYPGEELVSTRCFGTESMRVSLDSGTKSSGQTKRSRRLPMTSWPKLRRPGCPFSTAIHSPDRGS